MYRLIFKSGPQRGRRVGIRQGPVILGRHPDATLRLPEPEIALQHALIEELPDGSVRLNRLTTEARVRINRQDVEQVELHDGDVIEIGLHELQFCCDMAPAASIGGGKWRQLGLLQSLTLFAVGLLLTTQMIFLLVVSLWRQNPAVSAAAGVATTIALSMPTNTPPMAAVTNLGSPATVQLPASLVKQPTAASAHVTTPAQPVGNPAFSNELKLLQGEIVQLHHDIAAMPPPVPAAITNLVVTNAGIVALPPPIPVTNAAPAETAGDDFILVQAERMFKKTMARALQLDPDALDGELATIQTMAPDFIPPIIERAQLLARRAQTTDAMAQWQLVQKLAKNDALRTRAAAEIAQLKKIINAPRPTVTTAPPAQLTAVSVPPAVTTTTAPSPALHLPRVRVAQPAARITHVEPQKLMAGEKYDEMRLLSITVGPAGAAPLNPVQTELVVTFFDRGEKSGHIAPSRAVVPGTALRAAAPASPDAPLEFNASYLVPRGFRQQETRQQGEAWRYFGYRIELFSGGELQDRREHPADLLPAE